MAILGTPAIAVVDEDAVAAFAILDPVRLVGARCMVANVIPCAHHLARSSRQHRDVTVKPTAIGKSKVRAFVAIANKPAASIIAGSRSRVPVNVVLDGADGTDLTVHGQRQAKV